MLLRRTVVCCILLAACRDAADPVADAAARLNELAARTAARRDRLAADLADRDDLGPGEYRDRLRAAFADALRALALEHEAAAASILASASDALPSLLPDLPLARAPGGGTPLSPSALAVVAAERARAASAFRERAAEVAREAAQIRARVIDLRLRTARLRLQIARRLAALRAARTLGAGELWPLARARGVQLTGVERRPDGRATIRAEGTLDALAAFALDLGTLPGLSIARIAARGTAGGVRLRVEVRRPPAPEGVSAPAEPSPSSSPAVWLARRREAQAAAAALAVLDSAEPGPAPVLAAVGRALERSVRLVRLEASDSAFAVVLRTPPARARRFLERLTAQPGIEAIRPALSGPRLVVRGRWRAGTAPSRQRVASPAAARPSRIAPTPPVRHPIEAYTLAGVVSAGQGTVRALVRDGSGRPHIVKVGSRIGLDAQVSEIGKDYVLARAGGRLVRIRAR